METELDQEPRAKATPPTLSPVTLYNFVETHRRTLPNRIDRSIMKSVAGSDQPRILAALQFLGLTEASGRPTKRFERLRDAEGDDVKAAWAEALQFAYPDLFQGFNLATATQGELDERFKNEFKISGDTVRKAVAFFISLARNAGITLSPYFKQTRQRSPRNTTPKPPSQTRKRGARGGRGSSKDDEDVEEEDDTPDTDGLVVDKLLAKFPEFDPNWTAEVQQKWFDAFGKLQDQLKQ